MYYNYKIELFIPNKNNNGKKMNIEKTLKNLRVSNYTMISGIGVWENIKEKISIVEIWMEELAAVNELINNFKNELLNEKLDYKQEAVGLKINGVPYTFLKNEKDKIEKYLKNLIENDISNNYKFLIYDVYENEYLEWLYERDLNINEIDNSLYGRVFLQEYLNEDNYESELGEMMELSMKLN